MEPRILPPTLFSLHLRHIHWQTLCHTTQQQLTASPETYTSGTHGTAGVNCKPSSPTKSNFLSILASPFVCCCSFVFDVGAGLCSHACAFKNAAPPSRKNGNNAENKKKKNLIRQEIISYFTILTEIWKINAVFSSGGSAEPHSVWCFSSRLWLWALLLGNSALKKWNQHGNFKNSVQSVEI